MQVFLFSVYTIIILTYSRIEPRCGPGYVIYKVCLAVHGDGLFPSVGQRSQSHVFVRSCTTKSKTKGITYLHYCFAVLFL